MADNIPPDSTIASIWDKLKNPRQFVAGVRQKMMNCVKQHNNAHVKIGVTGRGYQPCYRITYRENGSEKIYISCWDNHQPLDKQDAQNQNWSTAGMTADEVDSFLKEKINWKGA